ncbi:hypothetical protein CLOM_g19659 [Closterium sp. NIES-68]|nr:hypothetical protein CLOM_g19659 [Closterium sp. NIES-68]GJP80522.1 hypothetical protein CLOP_g10728 [Closterium sp. NIES-67]
MATPTSAGSRADPRSKLRASSPPSPTRSSLVTALGGIICPSSRAKPARGPLSWLHGALCSPHHAALLRVPAALLFLLLLAAWSSDSLHWPLLSFPASRAVETGVGPSELAVEVARLQAIESLNSRLSGGSAKRHDDVAAGGDGDSERRAPRKVGGKAYRPVKEGERVPVNANGRSDAERNEGGWASDAQGERLKTRLAKAAEEGAQGADEVAEKEAEAGDAGGAGDGKEVEMGGRRIDEAHGDDTSDGHTGGGEEEWEKRLSEEAVEESGQHKGEARGDGAGDEEVAGGDERTRDMGDGDDDGGGLDRARVDAATGSRPTDGDGDSEASSSGNEGTPPAAHDSPAAAAAGEQDAAAGEAGHYEASPSSDQTASSPSARSAQSSSPRYRNHSQPSPSVAQPSCDGRRVFIYSMPPVFNDEIRRTACDDDPLLAWLTCDAFRNRAQGPRLPANRDGGRALVAALLEAKMGETGQARAREEAEGARAGEWAWVHRWYHTEQHQIEAVYRERWEHHPCRTLDDTEADVFLVPAYMGWNAYKNTLHPGHMPHPGLQLKEFLSGQPAFQRTKGARHVVVLGRAIWDFANHHLTDEPPHYNVIFVPELANVTFLTVEQPPYKESYATPIFSVPYTTTFHPASLAEINHWLALVAARPRPFRFSYVGGRRPAGTTSGPLRTALIAQCERAGQAECLWMKCTGPDEVGKELPLFTAVDAERVRESGWGEAVEAVVGSGAPGDAEGEDVAEWVASGCYDTWQVAVVMLQSTFCLQPLGDSSVRRSTFDSLIAGCIPVFFKEESFNVQYDWHFPADRSTISVTLDEQAVLNGTVDVAAELAAISKERVASMQASIRQVVPQLLYRHLRVGQGEEGVAVEGEGGWRDAFDVSFDRLVEEFSRRGEKSEGGRAG